MRLQDSQAGTTQRPRPEPLGWDYDDLPTPEFECPPVLSLGRNDRGRDLVVGDVHGQRETFERLLEKVGYAPADGDRLLLLGDLIDRGPDSQGMLQWLGREGVFCIRGNHEQFMLDALGGHGEMESLWMGHNGGQWAAALDDHQREKWHAALRTLPIALEVEAEHGAFLLVHAEVPIETPWWALKAWLEEGDRCATIRALWARERFLNKPERDRGVPDVWRTFHGHVPLKRPMRVGNMRWIDVGAAYPDRHPGAAIACVAIDPDGTEHEPVLVKVLDVDPRQVHARTRRYRR